MATRSDPPPEEFSRSGAGGDGAGDPDPGASQRRGSERGAFGSADPDQADPEPGQLLDQVLNPLLEDFHDSFVRGLLLLDHCPDRVLPADRRRTLRQRLLEAQAGLSAARALRAAAPTPMALDMATIQPWHALVVEVWSLSAAMRAAGVRMP